MSLDSPSLRLSVEQARSESIGYLAFVCTGKRLPLQVRQSAAGHYIGTTDEGEPISRESADYFDSHQDACVALATGHWPQRLSP